MTKRKRGNNEHYEYSLPQHIIIHLVISNSDPACRDILNHFLRLLASCLNVLFRASSMRGERSLFSLMKGWFGTPLLPVHHLIHNLFSLMKGWFGFHHLIHNLLQALVTCGSQDRNHRHYLETSWLRAPEPQAFLRRFPPLRPPHPPCSPASAAPGAEEAPDHPLLSSSWQELSLNPALGSLL